MSHALQRLTNAGLFYWLLHTKAQSPHKAALISPKGSDRQPTPLALPPTLAQGFPHPWLQESMTNPSLFLESTNPRPSSPTVSLVLHLFPSLETIGGCSSWICLPAAPPVGISPGNSACCRAGKSSPSQRLWDGAGSKGCQTGTSTREKVSIFVILVPSGNRYCLGQSQACLRLAPCKALPR